MAPEAKTNKTLISQYSLHLPYGDKFSEDLAFLRLTKDLHFSCTFPNSLNSLTRFPLCFLVFAFQGGSTALIPLPLIPSFPILSSIPQLPLHPPLKMPPILWIFLPLLAMLNWPCHVECGYRKNYVVERNESWNGHVYLVREVQPFFRVYHQTHTKVAFLHQHI